MGYPLYPFQMQQQMQQQIPQPQFNNYNNNPNNLTWVQGEAGADGVGISDITKTNTNGLVDTYTIALTNGETKTFTVTNGKSTTEDTDLITKDEVLNYLLGGND